MNPKFFYIHGGNGASFFFSMLNMDEWRKSLEFYRAVSQTARIKKFFLRIAYSILKQRASLTKDMVSRMIEKELCIPVSIPESASAMVSPTRDKVIIHIHGYGYEKIAIGKSKEGIVQEVKVYQLLTQAKPHTFAFSSVEKIAQDETSIRFFMQYANGIFLEDVPSIASLTEALIEFFSLGKTNFRLWEELYHDLLKDFPDLMERVSDEMKKGGTPVGLVHRDFKPWNVKSGNLPLFFDFESATFSGCPLEDFFNYIVDPLLRYQDGKNIQKQVRAQLPIANKILKKMNIPTENIQKYWKWYLLERTVFWTTRKQTEIAQRFLSLYES